MKKQPLHPAFAPAVQHFTEELRALRTGRATTGLVESVTVDHYGTTMRLRELASMTIPDPRTIQIEPWDASAVPAVEKALVGASLGAQPTVKGKIIRVTLPPLTEERRAELSKRVGRLAEDTRIAVRNVREKLLRQLKQRHDDGELSDDALEGEKKSLQEHVNRALADIETIGEGKTAELKGGS